MRILCSDIVKLQSGNETNHRLLLYFAQLGQVMILLKLGAGERVKAAPAFFKSPGKGQSPLRLRIEPGFCEVPQQGGVMPYYV
jgi:hypothetical protein